MKFTLIFDEQVLNKDSQLGKLKRIIVNNGIANQVTIDPGLLSYERVVPINVFVAGSDDTMRVDIDEDDWKAYPSFIMDQHITNPNEEQTGAGTSTPMLSFSRPRVDTEHPVSEGPLAEQRTVDQMSVVLTSSTTVVNENAGNQTFKLRGLAIDTGRPQMLLLEGGESLPYDAVTMLDEERIHVGGKHQQPILDADRGYERTTIHDPAGDQRR